MEMILAIALWFVLVCATLAAADWLGRCYFFPWLIRDPQRREKVRRTLQRLGEPMYPAWLDDWLMDRLDDIQESICRRTSHGPVRDQCGNPEHDYCIWCQVSLPHGVEPRIGLDGSYL